MSCFVINLMGCLSTGAAAGLSYAKYKGYNIELSHYKESGNGLSVSLDQSTVKTVAIGVGIGFTWYIIGGPQIWDNFFHHTTSVKTTGDNTHHINHEGYLG